MRLIDASYYTKAPYVIANASANPLSAMEKACAKVIEDIVDNFQKSFLIKVLGEEQGGDIETELESVTSLDDLSDETKAICKRLIVPFGSYIYFQILRHAQSVSGITGVYQLVSSDKSISPRFLQVQCWNSMALTLRALCLEMKWENCDAELLTTVNAFNI